MTKSSISTNSPHPLDVVLGSRIRSRRRELQLSQMRLAQQVGVTFQQIQKYERGANRVSFSRLAEIAEALDCTIAHMVDGVETRKASPVFMKCALHLNEPDAADLLDAYCAIRSLTHRRAVLDLVRQL
ncbi:MAG: helix-turn-helix transcriptional regulator, partial [Alphaproteobacteria bacterium]|nr:helix-turn-helix transcriptional regulator [Alphaproteobacteria bacterium]